jgi:indole-3-glycerol phosphate synthase
MSGDVLTAIVAAARKSADERERIGLREIEREAAARAPRGAAFRAGLQAAGIRVIAECKRRSPSRGILRMSYEAAAIAREYEQAGAAAISVLTEPAFFDGSLKHLREVRGAVALPLLRKDFIVTPFQLLEARACGADAVLLIVAALDDRALRELLAQTRALELAALVEVHDRDELERALDAGADTVGVNSRNLRTLEVHPDVFDELGSEIPDDVGSVAESGLTSGATLKRLKAAGYDAFLIGERFMTEPNPGRALANLLAAAAAERLEEVR